MTSARSGRTPVRAGGATTFGDVSWGPVAVHSGSIFNHVDVLDLVRVVINLLLRLGLFFPDPTQSHTYSYLTVRKNPQHTRTGLKCLFVYVSASGEYF